jgi:hypothetical protein
VAIRLDADMDRHSASCRDELVPQLRIETGGERILFLSHFVHPSFEPLESFPTNILSVNIAGNDQTIIRSLEYSINTDIL